MTDGTEKIKETMKVGDRVFVYEHRVVMIEAVDAHDDFKDKTYRYVTVAEKSRPLTISQVQTMVQEVITS